MKIAFNPSTVAALTSPPNNKDITFDLKGHSIYARGVEFKGTDTNTWRDIKVNNVSIGSHTLDLRNGSNTTLTNTNGVVTINSTWRPVVDSLTSNSTTSSLSANQGRVLAGLINGKSDSDHNHDGRYVKRSGDTMLGALNFANNTWNKVGDDSYMGDCNVSGHVGIKAAKTIYPGVAFFNDASTFLGNLTAYNGNIKYGTYSLQFLDNGNTSVGASTWTNPFSAYDSNAVKDGQAICVWGQSSYLGNLVNDTGYMSLWLKRVSAKVAALNMVLDGEYYANGNQRLAHVSEIPSSLKNPYALTISLNGTSQGPYDGSAAKNINITPSSIGAAVSNHSHDYLVVNTADNKSFNSAYHNFQVLYAGGNNSITGKPANVDAFGLFRFRAGYGWSGQMLLANGGSLYIRSSLDAKMTSTLAWKTILDSSNYSSTLDSRYYTESEVNSLLDAKLNRQNLSYGTWNPRGYNLAADYFYNGGDLSISESGGQIHVSVDGYFWQNDGRSRVLDTSDVAELKGNLTVFQYLSATDTTWWPLIWGGGSHNNTSDSTGAVYKSHDVLSWQTSSQTLYATHLRTTYIDLENNRGIFQVTSKGTSPLKGIKLPDLQSNGIGMFSKLGDGSGADEGGIIISADTSVIYNSFGTGWGLSVRDIDRGQTDISGGGTIAFGVKQDYRAYSLGGFEKSGSNNSYVLLGGGGHKLESALNVANANTVGGYHYNDFTYKKYIGYNRNGPYNMKVFSMDISSITLVSGHLIFDIFSNGYSNNRVYFGRYEVSLGHWNDTDKNPTVYSRWIFKTNSAYDCVHVVKDLSRYKVDVYIESSLQDCNMGLSIVASSGFNMISSSPWVNLPSASSNIQIVSTTYLSFMGNASSATKVIVNQHTTNNTNYPLVWSNQPNTSNVTENQLYKSWADLYYNPENKRLTVGGSVVTSSFIKSGGNYSQLLRADGGVATFNWTGQSGQPTWLWGGNSQHSYYVYNPSNFRVAYAASAGNADTLDGEHASNFVRAGTAESSDLNKLDTYSFIKSVYSTNKDTSPKGNTGWYNVIQAVHRNGAGDGPSYIGQIALGMTINMDDMFFRGRRSHPWKTVIHSGNIANQSVKYATNAGNSDKVDGYHATDGRTFTDTINWSNNWNDAWSDGTNKHPWYGFDHRYPNTGTYSTTISDFYGMTIKTANNLRLDCANLLINGIIHINNVNAQIRREGSTQTWVNGRNGALLRETSVAGYHVLWSLKTTNGSWDFGEYNAVSAWNDIPVLSYITDSNYNSGNNVPTYQIKFPLASGTVALTSDILNYYWANVKISTSSSTTTSPTVSNLTASSFIRMNSIRLERTNEINSSNNDLLINYGSPTNVSLCSGGGYVGIGTTGPAYKLDVNGQMRADGFHHVDHNSNDAVLLAGGGYALGVLVIYWAKYQIYIGDKDNDNSCYKLSGNYPFVTRMKWEKAGSMLLDINFPYGYNRNNTLIFGNGDHRTNSNWMTPIYVTITTHKDFGYSSTIRVMLSDDSSFNTGFANIYFMSMAN